MAKVLVVDDERTIRLSLTLFLKKEGHTVESAENATVALEMIRNQKFDVVMSDIVLPGITGVELLQQVRQADPNVQVIMMTGQPTIETAAESVRYGAADYLSKPLALKEASKAVANAAQVKTLNDEKRLLEESNRQYREHLQELVTQRTQALNASSARLHSTVLGVIRAMSVTVEIRDPYTAGHQHRVAALAQAIATNLGCPPAIVASVYFASLIHDLGKIMIPSEILSKPGKLVEPEMAIIRMHPQQGFEILKNIEFPWPIAELVLQHHERMDGSGYPNHLKQDEILLGARILCVADVVEAMAAHRPYRPSLGLNLALKEIRQGRGRIYDANVVDCCNVLFTGNSFHFTDTPTPPPDFAADPQAAAGNGHT